MLRLLRPTEDFLSSDDASGRAAELLLDRLCAEGRLTRPEAEVLRRALPTPPPRGPAWPSAVRAAVIDLDTRPAAEHPSLVERRVAELDVPEWAQNPLSALRHHALLRLPDMGDRYQRLRAILVLMLVT